MTQELTQAMVDLREAEALAMVDRQLADGADPVAILADCKAAMDTIGGKSAAGQAFIPELIMAGENLDGCRLMIGGAPITGQVVAYTGADGYGKDAVEAVELARQWIGGQ